MTALACAATMMLAAGAAIAAPSVTGFVVTPSTGKAGATGAGNNVKIHLDIGGTAGSGQDIKDLIIHLPPGLIANPQAAKQCTEAQLGANACPAASQVGEVSNTVNAYVAVIPVTQTVSGELFNVRPRAGEPGRFGIVLHPPVGGPVILQSGAALRSNDFGLDSILKNLPTTAGGLQIDIKALDLTLYGKGGKAHDQGNFVRLPTSCGSQTFGVDITNYSNQSTSGSKSITTQNCASLPFSPVLSAKIGAPGATISGKKPPLTTIISQTIAEAGLKSATVTLPKNVLADTGYLNQANYCPKATFDANPAQCQPSSRVGEAVAASPLLADPLTGTLTLIEETPGQLPTLGLDLTGSLHLQVFGNFNLEVIDGTVRGISTFPKLPDIPISRFQLDFSPKKLIKIGRDLCVAPPVNFEASFNSFAGGTTQSKPDAAVEGCGPAGKPKAKLKLSHGSASQPVAQLNLTAGVSKIKKVKLSLPSKLKPAATASLRKAAIAKSGSKKLKASAISSRGQSVSVKLGKASKGLLKLKPGSLKAKNPVKPGTKLKFKIAITDNAGTVTKLTKTVTARP